ncbi:MAG: HAD hydrolase family protein [Bacteroidales bacterium]|jgi:3-deoxy-D-manno-octulosonate 8-phosphate phosphatase (KDO 8-P phosphatase)|nr:HAD hydrolase family protein [Bacteroidales bacterium]
MTNFKEELRGVKAFIFDIDGVLSTQTIALSVWGIPLRTVNLRDGYAIQLAVKKGYHVGVISGANSKEYIKRLKILGVNDIYLNSRTKTESLKELVAKWNVDPAKVLYMGDDIPDYEAMKMVGLPACPADADSEIKQIAVYISDKKGGEGCVRDVIEQALRLHKNWMDHEAFSW